jgi:hypothetical protein
VPTTRQKKRSSFVSLALQRKIQTMAATGVRFVSQKASETHTNPTGRPRANRPDEPENEARGTGTGPNEQAAGRPVRPVCPPRCAENASKAARGCLSEREEREEAHPHSPQGRYKGARKRTCSQLVAQCRLGRPLAFSLFFSFFFLDLGSSAWFPARDARPANKA